MTVKLKIQKFLPATGESAVSPVIATVLMVSITVILAAVISAFVFGMAGNIPRTKIVTATIQQPAENYALAMFQGGQDAGTCDFIQWKVNNTYAGYMCVGANIIGDSSTCSPGNKSVPVGSTLMLPASAGKDNIIATGHFTDGTQQVLVNSII